MNGHARSCRLSFKEGTHYTPGTWVSIDQLRTVQARKKALEMNNTKRTIQYWIEYSTTVKHEEGLPW